VARTSSKEAFLENWSAREESSMQESLDPMQREAFRKGQQLKQWHRQQQRQLDHEALATLAADFAHLTIFQSSHYQPTREAHTRAGACAKAFLDGYQSDDEL
jgi:hypothetical protein